MSTKLVKTIHGRVLAALVVLTLTPGLAFGQPNNFRSAQARKIVGLWDVTVTQVNCQTGSFIRSFPSEYLFSAGGTLTEIGAGAAPSLRTTGLGTWEYSSGQTYTAVLKFFRFNPDGTFAGSAKATATIELSGDGNTYNATVSAELLDASGNVIATLCNTQTATRVQ